MAVTTVDDLLARDRRDERTALVDATGRTYDRHWLCTTSWKAGNFLRHAGVREGAAVGVAGREPFALLGFFGATLLEARTRFDPPTDLSGAADLRALVAPTGALDAYDLPPGATPFGYGETPADPAARQFDAGLWSENPSFPPLEVDPDTDLLSDGEWTLSHRDALEAARAVIEEYDLEEGDRVVLRGPPSDPGVVAGVLAPLLADAAIVLTDGSDGDDPRGDCAVSSEPVPEPERIDPTDALA